MPYSRLRARLFFPLGLLLLCGIPRAARASVSVCVDVQVKSWALSAPAPRAPTHAAAAKPPAESVTVEREFEQARAFYDTSPSAAVTPPAPPSPATEPGPRPRDPYTVDPAAYLKRLLEYEITHAEGFVAVPRDCSAHVVVELYTLETGWTAFARYTMNGREEKVDRVELDEFEALAQRIATSLLEDRPISDTLTRENVLQADSARAVRTVRGRGHAAFAMGGSVRVGKLPTAENPDEPVQETVRVLTPVEMQLGYRMKIKSWGLDALTRVNFGTNNTTALRSNQLGGHVDYAGSGAIGLHFLRYASGAAVNSLYFGGGAALELSLFDVIRPEGSRSSSDRSWLTGGGLNVELLAGYEFMRASAVQFFGEVALALPTYAFETENSAGSVHTYMPGGLVHIGVLL